MQKIRVGVLRGGPSSEYARSLATGAVVLQNISDMLGDVYEPQDIFISRDGVWHRNGIPIAPHDAISHLDVVMNALYDHHGEDGKVQHLLELHGVPFTGSRSFASAVGMNKVFSKEIFKREGIKTPYYKIIEEMPAESEEISEEISNIFRAFSPPIVIKSVFGESSLEMALVKTPALLLEAMTKASEHGAVMIEEYIPGAEATVGVIDGYRGRETYTLPVFSENFSDEVKDGLEELAKKVHRALGFRHYSSVDFIVSPRRGIFVIETNTLPDLTKESVLSSTLRSVGASASHFLDHILQLALGGK